MSMKKAQLEKFLAKKVEGAMRRESTNDRYGAASGQVHDKREKRRRDQEAGLVPFAVKLPQDLVSAMQERARATGTTLNDAATALLRQALGTGATTAAKPAAPAAAPAATAPAKTATRPKAAAAPAPIEKSRSADEPAAKTKAKRTPK